MTTNPLTKQTLNAFCPTGKGGGVDPTCSPGKSAFPSDKSLIDQSQPAGKVQMHGMSVQENMRSVTVNGVEVLFSKKTASAARETLDSAANVHPALWQQNKKIIFSSQEDSQAQKIAEANGLEGFESAASGGDGNIVVYGSRPMTSQTLAHESAHNLAVNTWGDANLPLMDKRGKLTNNPIASEQKIKMQGMKQRVSNAVTDYGSNSRAEDFAELVTAYNEIHIRDQKEYRGATAKSLQKRSKSIKAIKELLGD